jgi:predicted ABC-type ATPase
MKRIIIIAGPNGAGKTTFAKEFLPHEADCPNFINADLIAAGLSPFDPDAADIQAGRVMLAEMKRYVANGESFAFETTLSGRHYVKQIRKWQAAGYRIELIYLELPSIRMALARVRSRVAQGGHFVPAAVVRRRFKAGWSNFERIYQAIVDHWIVYDSSGQTSAFIDQGEKL